MLAKAFVAHKLVFIKKTKMEANRRIFWIFTG